MLFRDRADAGRRLAERLTHLRHEEPIVLALPRGGVTVGYEVARVLGAPLDVIVARKLGAPFQPELGIGAIAPGGVRVLNEEAVRWLGISEEEIGRIAERESREMERRIRLYRGDQPMPDLRGRTVILVDDGIATGVTTRAAIESVRQSRPQKLVLAVPVCAAETSDILQQEVDEFICLSIPTEFVAVGVWYENFTQVSDEEVIQLLARAKAEVAESHGVPA
jgi:predicted phosphoribosyltransferase